MLIYVQNTQFIHTYIHAYNLSTYLITGVGLLKIKDTRHVVSYCVVSSFASSRHCACARVRITSVTYKTPLTGHEARLSREQRIEKKKIKYEQFKQTFPVASADFL